MATIPPRALEEVYAVPPADFTRTRNAKAAALAKAGQREAAVALRRLRRPAAILWAVNQLGRLDARRLDAFIDAVARLRRTQLRDPQAVGEAVQHQRAALDALLEVARTHLAEHGLGAGPEALRRISSTLQGAAVDSRHADDLRHGRLTEELAAPGFEVFAGAKPARLKVLPGGKKPAKAADIEQRDRKQAADEAAKEVEALSGKLADARRRLAKLRR